MDLGKGLDELGETGNKNYSFSLEWIWDSRTSERDVKCLFFSHPIFLYR